MISPNPIFKGVYTKFGLVFTLALYSLLMEMGSTGIPTIMV